jgi:F-type H+-transporting ATPase subunit delta
VADPSVARRYAEAVFDLASEGSSYDQWQADLNDLAAVVSDRQVIGILENAKTPMSRRMGLLDQALAQLSPMARNLTRLLLQRGRLAVLPEIAAMYGEMLDMHRGVVRAEVTTAVPLTDEDRQAVVDRLRALTGAVDIRLQSEVDPRIIGGVVLRVGDRLIDGSTRSRLVQLKRQLAGSAS